MLNNNEYRVLKSIVSDDPEHMITWGAWVGAVLEFLQEDGYINNNYNITDSGKKALKQYEDTNHIEPY